MLVGRRGNDTLRGEFGDDVYVWNPGDGNNVVQNPYGDNTLRFGAGVAPENVRVTSDGKDLFLTIGEGGERITVSDWFADGRSLSSVRFSDGTVWSAKEVESRVDRRILGTNGDDVLNGLPWDDIIVGGKGNNVLRGGAGRDTYEWNDRDRKSVV